MNSLETINTKIDNLSERNIEFLKLAINSEWGTPDFKMRHFVGDAQITPFAKMKQFFLELRSREEMIEDLQVAAEKSLALIDIEKEMLEEETSEAKKRLINVEITKLKNDYNRTSRRLNAAYEERNRVLRMIDEMYETGEAFLKDGREIKDIFHTPEEEQLERELWTIRLGKQAALEMVAYGRVGTGNLDAITMLDEEQQIETVKLALGYSTKVNNSLAVLNDEVQAQIDTSKISLEIEK